jgi:pimeloyl-ACP methyl ester carboxylesterase
VRVGESSRVVSDGIEIAFDVAGAGRDVVWVHGLCERKEVWTPITDRVVDEFRCIRVDFRGHGESTRLDRYEPGAFLTDLHAVIRATCAESPMVVGHSLGGIVATVASAVGMTGPVLCVDQPLEDDPLEAVIRALAPRLRDPAEFPDALMEEKDALGMRLVPPPVYAELEHLTRTCDQRVVLDTWQAMLDDDPAAKVANDAALWDILPSIRQPYLAIHGSDVGDEYQRWFRQTITVGELECWPGHGHWLHHVDPDRFVERFRRFAAKSA